MIFINTLVGLLVLGHLFAGSISKSNSPITKLILSAIDNLCPYSRICKQFDEASKPSSQTEWTSEYVPCCGACSCEVGCGKTEKCCFSGDNYESARQSDNHTVRTDRDAEGDDFSFSCLFPGTPRNMPKLYRHYEMIDRCPFKMSTNEHNTTQKQFPMKCGDVIVAWSSLFPVYSPSTKQLYKNNVCSRCHDVTDGVVWDISISCIFENKSRHMKIDISEVLNIDSEKKSESSSCTLTFSFPGNWSDLEHARCITEPLVNKCSGASFQVPANINMTQDEVVRACESSFYSPVKRKSQIFANVFCSICNLDDGIPETMCSNPNTIPRHGGHFSFLLKGTDMQEKYFHIQKSVKGIQKACLDIPNSNLERQDCRRIHCRTGQIQDPGGECHYVSTFMFTAFEMSIDLLPNEDIPTEFVKSGFGSLTDGWLNGPFLRYWKLIMVLYEPYTAQGKNIIRKFTVSLRIQTSISLERLLKNVKRLMEKRWYANLNGTTFELRQEFSRIYEFGKIGKETYCTNSSFSKDYESICALKQLFMPINEIMHQAIIITKMVFCEQVELRDSEYEIIETKRVMYYKLKKLTLFGGEFVSVYHPSTGNYTVRLCLADAGFKILYVTTSSSFPIRIVHIHLLALFLIFCIKRNF